MHIYESKKKKKKFIRLVNKIIKSLSSLSVTLSSLSLSPSLSHLISQNSLKQISLPPPIVSHRRLPHASSHLTPPHASHLISSHLMLPIACSSSRRSEAHQAAVLKLIEAASLKPMELADPVLLPTQLANVVLVCDW